MKALLIVLALAGVAHADDKAAAQRYFNAGAKAYAAQNFAAAIASFEEAYKAMPAPEIAFSAAQAYRRQYRVDGKPEYVKRSVELYRIYLDRVKTGGRVGDAADSLGEMQRELDRLSATGAKIETVAQVERTRIGVTIQTGENDATVLREIGEGVGEATKGLIAKLDGKPLEPFALVDVEPGEHTIEVAADGYEPIAKKHRAVQGASELVDIKLVAKSAKVAIATEDDAAIVVDGRPRGTAQTGSIAFELAAGKHVMTITRRGRQPLAREITVARGETIKLDLPLEKTGKRAAVPWIFAGAGIIGALATTTALVALVADGDASAIKDQIVLGDRPPSDADEYDRLVQRRDDARNATYVLGGIAVAAGAIGLGLYLFDTPSADGVQVVPMATGTSAGAAFTGTW